MIQDLENSDLSLSNIRNLSSLYIVKKHLTESKIDNVTAELNDILPSYLDYVNTKRKYQLHEVTEQAIYLRLEQVCKEIKEFLHILYTNTDTPKEREILKKLITQIREAF